MRVLLSPILMASTAIGAPDRGGPWPQVNGPYGNFNPREAGVWGIGVMEWPATAKRSEDG